MDALIQLSSLDIAVIIAYFILLGIIAYWSGSVKTEVTTFSLPINHWVAGNWFNHGVPTWVLRC